MNGVAPGGSDKKGILMKFSIGSDHHGLDLKIDILDQIAGKGHEIGDVGAHASESVDYPDVAAIVGRLVSKGEVDRGILICGTGIGMSIAANKFAGVRAAVCHDVQSAELSRRHNDANVLCLSADQVATEANQSIVAAWLSSGIPSRATCSTVSPSTSPCSHNTSAA